MKIINQMMALEDGGETATILLNATTIVKESKSHWIVSETYSLDAWSDNALIANAEGAIIIPDSEIKRLNIRLRPNVWCGYMQIFTDSEGFYHAELITDSNLNIVLRGVFMYEVVSEPVEVTLRLQLEVH